MSDNLRVVLISTCYCVFTCFLLPFFFIELKKELAAFISEQTAEFEERTTSDIRIADNEAAVADLAKAIQELHTKVLRHWS